MSSSSLPRASKPQSHRTISSVSAERLGVGIALRLSPPVPAGVCPHLDLRLPFKEPAEELLDLRIAGERLGLLRGLPGVYAKELPLVHWIQVDGVSQVARLLGHLLCGASDLVVNLPHRGGIRFEAGSDGDRDRH